MKVYTDAEDQKDKNLYNFKGFENNNNKQFNQFITIRLRFLGHVSETFYHLPAAKFVERSKTIYCSVK